MKDKYFIPNQEYKKCAPSITFSEGSCFSLKELLYIAKSYNKHLKNQKVTDIKRYIIVSDSKIDLISELSKKIKECDSDQLCWLKWASKDTEKQTFRPKGPTIKSQWLSTTDINNILDQYENKYDGFLSLGAVPVDFWKLNLLSSKKNFKGRRSLYVVKDIKKGEVLTAENIKSIRPRFGLHPKYLKNILNQKSKQKLKRGDRTIWRIVKK